MTDIAMRVDKLSKQDPSASLRTGRIGRAQQRHDTLRDAVVFTFGCSNVQRSNEMIWALRLGPEWTFVRSMRDWYAVKSAVNVGWQALGWMR